MDLRLILLGICEIAALIFIWRLWRRHKRRSLALRICWTLLLLAPVAGIIFYGLALNDPSEKPGWGGENNQGWGDDYTHEPCLEQPPSLSTQCLDTIRTTICALF